MENIITTEKHSIILVEDDRDQRCGLSEYLQLRGFDVTEAGSAVEFHMAFSTGTHDVAILDVNLPDVSGFDLARHLSARGDVGVIMLTARHGSEDRRNGYEKGADIYFTKPADSEELALAASNLATRICRERAGRRPDTASPVAPAATSQAWTLDRRAFTLSSPQGKLLHLSSKEALLLEYLAYRTNETVSRVDILRAYGDTGTDANTRRFDVALSRLRAKAKEAGMELPLQVSYGIGVKLLEKILIR
ncbi:response regulator transcription factor [Agrobacterium rosae]|uniref:response regulator transcription factor n=1 Tax=Agrobacterium rosae TaxID=1972867 RepID=UPI003A803FD7